VPLLGTASPRGFTGASRSQICVALYWSKESEVPLRVVFLLLLVAPNFLGCDHNTTPTTPTPGPSAPLPFVRVSGRVTDYTTNVPAPGFRLEWRTVTNSLSTPSELRTVVTDTSGDYTLELPPADRYLVSFPVGTQSSATVIVPTKSYRTDFSSIRVTACSRMASSSTRLQRCRYQERELRRPGSKRSARLTAAIA
jgi:hypothetical protein